MQKRTLGILTVLFALLLVGACKKASNKPATNGNVPHALADTFYYRVLIDTTWKYHGDADKDECVPSSSGVCSSFLYDATFTLSDSANPHPHDSIIRGWVGKTFVTNSDTVSKAYTFSITYPDSLYREVSTENTRNVGARLTVTSVDTNGRSVYNLDTAHVGYRCYKIRGTFNAKTSLYNDTLVHKLTQGVFSISVMESEKP